VRGVNTGHPDAAEQRRQASRDREALGRSRGGLSTKLHLLADARSRPLVHLVSPGQRGDTLAYAPLMARLSVPRPRSGPARTRPDRLLGDKAYSATGLRADLRRRRIRATIPVPADQVRHRLRRGRRGGRPPAFDAEAYKGRNTVERAINKLKDHRVVAMRTDKRGYIFTGTSAVAAIRIWLRDLTRQDRSDRL
jgi:transposase